MGVNRMTGVAWHVEKIKKVNPQSRNCFNCIFLTEDRWCKKNKLQCTNNNATVCKAFKNKHYTTDKIVNEIKQKERKNIVKQRDSIIETSKTKAIKHTIVQVNTNEDMCAKIIAKVNENGFYCFRGFAEKVTGSIELDECKISEAYLKLYKKPLKCKIKPNTLEVIQSGAYLTVAFEIVSFDYISKYNINSYKTIKQGTDCFYGQICLMQKK